MTCSLLSNFPHGFFTQQFAPRCPEEFVDAIQPTAAVFRVKQVHGGTVLTPTEIRRSLDETTATSSDEATLPDADGVLTEESSQAVFVCTADCVPALIADGRTGQVAAVHAGWRGTAAQIVPQAIARLCSQGSQLEDLRVVLGPAIAGDVYQVSEQVAAMVGATVLKEASAANRPLEQILHTLKQLPDSPLLPDPEPGRVRLDVRRVNTLQLEQLGLSREQVAIAPYCTYQHADHFFSYRRHRQKKVQWSGIVSV